MTEYTPNFRIASARLAFFNSAALFAAISSAEMTEFVLVTTSGVAFVTVMEGDAVLVTTPPAGALVVLGTGAGGSAAKILTTEMPLTKQKYLNAPSFMCII